MQRFTAKVDVAVALGFGCFMAWKEALIAFLNPVSNGVVFSPLVCQSFACCLVLVVALFGVAKNRAAFSRRLLNLTAAVLVTLATVAGVLLTVFSSTSFGSYVEAAVIGCAVAVLLYTWADVIAGVDEGKRVGTVVAGIAVASALGIAVGQCLSLGLCIAAAALGALTLAGFCAVTAHRADRSGEALMIRPASSGHFRLLMLAIVLYALVFGSISGTTAVLATTESTHSFTLGMSQAMLAISLVLLAAIVALGKPVRLSTLGRFLTPVLALLFLTHILLGGSANGWLPRLTQGFWQLVQVFVLLVLIEVAQSGQASLSFTFPLGWAVVSLGFAGGALFGQTMGIAFGPDPGPVQSITVLLTIVAVIASSILAAAQYPEASKALAASDAAGRADTVDAQPAETDRGEAQPHTDPIGSACACLVARYALSEREREVLDLLARGNTRASIAEKLCISENTVRVHVKNIYAKLHIHSKQQLIDMVDRLIETGV